MTISNLQAGILQATILVPTHNHAETLPIAVRSALRQTTEDLEVIIIGDGVTDDVRTAALELVAADPRVRFLDYPKGPHHGEIYRHEAIQQARSDAILYLCDDDVFLPDHVSDMVALLDRAHLVQSRNGYFDAQGALHLYPTDLADPEAVAWHLLEPRRNMVSLTGTAHSRTYYLALDSHWETTPAGQWPDHFMWKKFFRKPGFVGATSTRMTALQFPSSLDGRDAWSGRERLAELLGWATRIEEPGARAEIDALVESAARDRLALAVRELDLSTHRVHLAARELELVRTAYSELGASVTALQADFEAVASSHSMRITRPLRELRARIRSVVALLQSLRRGR